MKNRIVHDMNSALSSLSLAFDMLENEAGSIDNLAPLMREKVEQLKYCWNSCKEIGFRDR